MFDAKSLHSNLTAPGATAWEGRRGYWLGTQRRGLQAESSTGDSGGRCMFVYIIRYIAQEERRKRTRGKKEGRKRTDLLKI